MWPHIFLFICNMQISMLFGYNIEVDPSRTIVWGPGLQPERIIMRARYIFLQLVDSHGTNLTKSPGASVVAAQVHGVTWNGESCHISTQILDSKDGSFIIRYKINTTCLKMKLSIQVNNCTVPQLSLEFKGPVYEEDCYCPEPSITEWLNDYECPQNYTQVQDDLKYFTAVDFTKIRDPLIKRYHQPNSITICHYIVNENKIYRQCYGQHVGFKIFMDAILLSLARKVILPNLEFFVNLGDWPLVDKKTGFYPIFSWCGSTDTRDIVMPTYDITQSSLEAMGRVMLDMLSIQGNIKFPWEEKIEKLFWRGRDACRERLDLIDISRKYPDLFNVSITNFFFFKDEISKYGPGQQHTSFFDFFKYKYQLNIDGTVAAYRFPYLLAGDSLVFKQDSKYYEFFYKDLTPGIHYIPVKKNLSDLVQQITWAKKHDEYSLKVAKHARQFSRDNLLPQNIYCYYMVLLNEWSKRLKSKVNVLYDMEEVQQPKHFCKCTRQLSKDEL